jgi:translation initiation factor eIF-2B subunit epsilon
MPPKQAGVGKTRTSGGGGSGADSSVDEGMQAVLLADAFTHGGMAPLTLDTPHALLPLVNVPLIEYTLEFLAAQGVHEVSKCAGSGLMALRGQAESSCLAGT